MAAMSETSVYEIPEQRQNQATAQLVVYTLVNTVDVLLLNEL